MTETLLVALEGKRGPACSPPPSALPGAPVEAGSDRAEVGDLVELLGLGDYRDHHIGDLSTGTRRVVELAGLLALNAKVLCLDEPTAGLAQRETEAFGPLIVTVQRQLGRVGPLDRARHAPHHGHQRSGVLPGGRDRSLPRDLRRRCATTPG